jgi:hypothetical protein
MEAGGVGGGGAAAHRDSAAKEALRVFVVPACSTQQQVRTQQLLDQELPHGSGGAPPPLAQLRGTLQQHWRDVERPQPIRGEWPWWQRQRMLVVVADRAVPATC